VELNNTRTHYEKKTILQICTIKDLITIYVLNSLTRNKKNKLIIPHKKQTKLKIIEEKQFFNFETFHEKLQNKSFTCDKIHITEKCQIVENKIK
jgi:hypothetical protein